MTAMRNALIALAALALVAVIVVGARQASDHANVSVLAPLTRAEVSKPIAGAPPELAALRRQVNVLHGGGAKAFEAQVRALKGHPVVVNFWASWCGPCQRELPLFQREAIKRGASVAFLGVNVADERGQAKQLAAEIPMPYPSFEDPRKVIATQRFGAGSLPVTAFYDAAGKLAIVSQGEFSNEAKLSAAIERYALG
jgi:thiol-disulfide isomerase/thioredoxin